MSDKFTDNEIKIGDAPIEIYKAFEEVNIKNLNSIMEYTKDTRVLVRQLEVEMEKCQNQIATFQELLNNLRVQQGHMLQILHSGGTSG